MTLQHFGDALKRGVFPLILITLFWQTRIALFDPFALYDYVIPFLYLSDFLILIFLFAHLLHKQTWIYSFFNPYPRWWLVSLVVGMICVWVSAYFAVGQVSAMYHALKLTLLLLWSFSLADFLKSYPRSRVITLLVLGVIPLAVIGFAEVGIGRSLGFQWIGEWSFTKLAPGIANIMIGDYELLRPYATFPHPNVYGAIMGGSVLLWFTRTDKAWEGYRRYIVGILILGVILSFSRTVWLGLIGAGAYLYWCNRRMVDTYLEKDTKLTVAVALAGTGMIVLLLFRFAALQTWDNLSIMRRLELNAVAVDLLFDRPWIGTGPNQFVVGIDNYWQDREGVRYVQPVHNTPLLMMVELGIIGAVGWFIALFGLVYRCIQRIPQQVVAVWVYIAITSMFDHYWWTLQAGRLFIFLLLGVTLYTMKEVYERVS